MTTYLLFVGDNYYPEGGAADLVGAYRTLTGAVEASEGHVGRDWAHVLEVVGTVTEVVWTSGSNSDAL